MDPAELAKTWLLVTRPLSREVQIEALAERIGQVYEEGRQAGLEEGAYVCRHKLDAAQDCLTTKVVKRMFDEVAFDIEALKDKPEGGQ